jgi:xylan 1,4-beta-xylosidase
MRGEYIYHTMTAPTRMIDELKETRAIMADYPQIADMPLHITEFNSSYSPLCPIHDTAFNAAFVARILSEAGDYADSYSYWTFSDVFEEMDVPKSEFHGGFGLTALNGIKKPTFYTFEFFSKAGKELLYRDDNLLVTKEGDKYIIICWNSHADYWTDLTPAEISCRLSLPSLGKQAILIKKDVGGKYANPLQTWSNLGKPRTLTKEQVRILQASAEPFQTDEKLLDENGAYTVDLTIAPNHLCMIEIMPVEDLTDTYIGFDPTEFYGMK